MSGYETFLSFFFNVHILSLPFSENAEIRKTFTNSFFNLVVNSSTLLQSWSTWTNRISTSSLKVSHCFCEHVRWGMVTMWNVCVMLDVRLQLLINLGSSFLIYMYMKAKLKCRKIINKHFISLYKMYKSVKYSNA